MESLNIDILEGFHSSMEGLCLELLHQGYKAMLSEKGYDVDWKEDKLTVHYIAQMKKLEIRKNFQVSIISQFIIYSDEHAFGDEEVENAPRIDFKFNKWVAQEEVEYFAEAKNLSERDWKKKNGKRVNASYYYNRYVETGINHLMTNYYPNNCILIAYVLNGDKNVVLSNLNQLISSKFENYGIIMKPNEPVNEEFYISENIVEGKKTLLYHFFLQLA